MTEGSQEFCLRWNNHQATIISVFDYLLENETLVDCTLAAEGQYLKAHKVVLCACSPYLELLLSQHNDKHPILIFKDIKFSELKSMIEYMYKGEVNIAQDQLNHFLKAAESLQIKGLSESEEESTPTAAPTPRPPPPRAPPVQRTQPRPIPNTVALPDPHPESPKRLNRNEAVSPSRKRRRQVLPIQGRPSLSGDDASNASEGHLDQSNCDVPSAALATSDNSVAKVESNSELMLEPKTEYDDNSVEDITLDDDEEDYSQAGTSMDNSQMNFSGWQQMVGDKSGDDVFAGQDTGAQNSQEKLKNVENETNMIVPKTEIIMSHENASPDSDNIACHEFVVAELKEEPVDDEPVRIPEDNDLDDTSDSGSGAHSTTVGNIDVVGNIEVLTLSCKYCSSFSSSDLENIMQHCQLCPDEAFKSPLRKLVCIVCSYTCRDRGYMRKHIRMHLHDKSFSCPFCQYKTTHAKALQIHIRSHTGEKPYVCTECPFKSSCKAGLTYHKKAKHSAKHSELTIQPLRYILAKKPS